MTRILLSPPDVRDLERQALLDALDSNWLAPAGPALDQFEADLCAATGRSHAVGLASGTAALHLALLGAGVEPGDDVVCQTMTFIGSVAPVLYCGARPILVDSEAATWNLDPELLDALLTNKAASNELPAAVIAVDLYGICADYRPIAEICARFDVALIEDAAEAIGAAHPDGVAGSFGQSAILSFNGNKLITTSGGGALVTDDATLAERARFLSTQAREPVAHYEHNEIGFNYRLSNLLAALGSAQLGRLDQRIERRREIFERYRDAVADIDGVHVHGPPPDWTSNHWLTCLRIEPHAPTTPTALIAALDAADIEARPAWKPMHQQPALRDYPTVLNGRSDAIFAESLCLPSGSGMTDNELDRVAAVLTQHL